jgi:hypothetical protein
MIRALLITVISAILYLVLSLALTTAGVVFDYMDVVLVIISVFIGSLLSDYLKVKKFVVSLRSIEY